MSTNNLQSVKTIKTEVKKNIVEDVTDYVLPSVSKKYNDTIEKVTKEGSTYTIYFSKDYTAINQKSRKCKDIPGIKWYSKIAYLEKQNGYNEEEWVKWLNKNKIVWDGKNIPEYFWTKEQCKKYNKDTKKEG